MTFDYILACPALCINKSGLTTRRWVSGGQGMNAAGGPGFGSRAGLGSSPRLTAMHLVIHVSLSPSVKCKGWVTVPMLQVRHEAQRAWGICVRHSAWLSPDRIGVHIIFSPNPTLVLLDSTSQCRWVSPVAWSYTLRIQGSLQGREVYWSRLVWARS